MSTPPNKELNTELESFRQQWLSDLRSHNEDSKNITTQVEPSSSPQQSRKAKHPVSRRPEEEEDCLQGKVYEEQDVERGQATPERDVTEEKKELVSALDHYEEAMEKEAQGNMGDSLALYRRAYRLDNKVDRRYREKHFPHGPPKQSSTHHSHPPPPPPLHQQQQQQQQQPPSKTEPPPQNLTYPDLISSFSSLSIEPLPPSIEGAPSPSCPISTLPTEILSHILEEVAIADVADFVRLSLVCKTLAYLVATEQRIWKRVCTGAEFGFAAMHYRYCKSITWDPADEDDDEDAEDGGHRILDGETVVDTQRYQQRLLNQELRTLSLTLTTTYPTWQDHFRQRPRIRFNGAYISTVNYVRTGQASTNQATWGGAPIHIVTYYRYLRFFRDGTCISLLTTSEPADVVHHLTKENLLHHREMKKKKDVHASTLPSAVMALALRGRWRLSSGLEEEEQGKDNEQGKAAGNGSSQVEGDLFVETEGGTSKYLYRMDLALRSAGKGTRNNKVVWRGFYSYNKLTDDWAEFMLKNDKPFFFSRVKSYSLSE